MQQGDRELFFQLLSGQFKQPKTELYYTSHYTLLVAVVLSAQMTDAGVNKATPALFACADTPQGMLALGLEALKKKIRTINFYPTKARHILALSELLLSKHGGKVPDTRNALEALPGVGRKTANVVLNVAFNQPVMPVDTHVFRVANRTGLAAGKTVLQVEKKLEKSVPKAYGQTAHHLLILHGRYVCKARNPLCATCVVAHLCAYNKKIQKLDKTVLSHKGFVV